MLRWIRKKYKKDFGWTKCIVADCNLWAPHGKEVCPRCDAVIEPYAREATRINALLAGLSEDGFERPDPRAADELFDAELDRRAT